MNEKFSFIKSLILLGLSSTMLQCCGAVLLHFSHVHTQLRHVRDRCFYHSHQLLKWQYKKNRLGFIREGDHHFYALTTESKKEKADE